MNTSTHPETTSDAPPAEFVDSPSVGATSTLIEFPGAGRARPQWRKDLSERVREIQQRRASEAARDVDESGYSVSPSHQAEAGAMPLGLVPQIETPELNPLVAKALERIERARQQPTQPAPRTNARGGGAAAAAATRPTDESYQASAPARASHAEAQQPAPHDPQLASDAEMAAGGVEQTAEPARATTLVVVPSPAAAPPPAGDINEAHVLIKEALSKPRPRRHLSEIADDALLMRREATILPQVAEPAQELSKAPSLPRRAAAGFIDLLIIAFATSPFAAVMELTSGNWNDLRVAGSLAGVVVVIMFVYLTASVALTGRTWGMALVSLRVADARSGLIPTAGRCARRAAAYMLTLATLGVGLLPALFGGERRAAHDRLSGTVVVRAD